MDRRALFFFGAAAVCLALVPLTPEDLRYVPAILAGVYFVLAVLSWIDVLSRRHDDRGRTVRPDS